VAPDLLVARKLGSQEAATLKEDLVLNGNRENIQLVIDM
jgi:hypothetical protein